MSDHRALPQDQATKRTWEWPETLTRTGISSDRVGARTLEGMHGGAYSQYYRIEAIEGHTLHLRKVNGDSVEVEPGVFSTHWSYTDGSPVP